jgi:hypothetical protein
LTFGMACLESSFQHPAAKRHALRGAISATGQGSRRKLHLAFAADLADLHPAWRSFAPNGAFRRFRAAASQ